MTLIPPSRSRPLLICLSFTSLKVKSVKPKLNTFSLPIESRYLISLSGLFPAKDLASLFTLLATNVKESW